MKRLAVFSGKGGTGKTTLVASFVSLAERVVAVDCDVDAANLALVLPGEDGPENPFMAGRTASFDPEVCIDCGQCAPVCRFDAIAVDPDGRHRVVDLACEGCGACEVVCPVGAVRYLANRSGSWWVRRLDPGWLVHAALGIAEDNSGKLVARVREEADAVAEREGLELVLVDGPPGVGCPVHAAMANLGGLLAVAEPGVSGEHDLVRLLDLAEHFGIRASVAVNKWDLSPEGTRRIEAVCAGRGVEVVGRVPFHEQVPRLLSRGILPVAPPAPPALREAIARLWARWTAWEDEDR